MPGTGRLAGLQMRPARVRRMQIRNGDADDSRRLCAILNQEGATLGARVTEQDGFLNLHPSKA